jgi:hypothetical protein
VKVLVRVGVHDPAVLDKVAPAHVSRAPGAAVDALAHALVEPLGHLAEQRRRQDVVEDEAGKVLRGGRRREPERAGLAPVVRLALEQQDLVGGPKRSA